MPDDDVIGFTVDTDPNDDDRLYMGVDIASTPVDRHVLKVDFLGRRTFKDSVRLATEVNDSLSGLAARDGITPIANDRVLVKAQTAGAANGIYLAQSGAWTRAKDFDTSPKATSGAFMVVQEGTVNADKIFQLTTNEPITLATTALVFTEFTGAGESNTIASLGGGTVLTAATPKSGVQLQTVSIATTAPIAHSVAADLLTITLNALVNADISASAAIDFSKLATLTSGNLLVGSSGNVVTSVNPTGDIDISNTGVFSISAAVIIDADINASAAIAFSKLAVLTSGNLLVGSAGNVVTSVNPTGDIDISATGVFSINAGVIVTADIGDNQVTFAKTQDITTNRLLGRNTAATGDIEQLTHDATLEFNVLEFRRAAITGDVTIAVGSNAAVFGVGVIVDADINATAAIAFSKLATLTSGNLLVGSAGNVVASVNPTGDVDITNAGVFSITAGAIVNADVNASAAIVMSKITGTVAQFNTALSDGTFAYIGVANAWGTPNQNIAATGKWQEGGINISPIGIHDIPVGATAMYVTTNTPATGLTLTNFATGDIDLQTFDFTSTTLDETVQFRTPMPRNYNNGAITVTINWSQASGTGNVVWRIGAVARGQSEAIGLAFTYSADLVDAAGTANQVQSTTTASFTPAGTPVDDDELHFEVQRQGSDALDTFTGTARLHSIVIHITTDAATAA